MPRGIALAGLFAMLAIGSMGCVTAGKYETVVDERDQLARSKSELEKRVAQLESVNESGRRERVKLLEELEDLSEAHELSEAQRNKLRVQVDELRGTTEVLDEMLGAREAELEAVTAEVRDLQSTYQGLVDDLESEVAKGEIEIEQLRTGVKVAVADEILFDSGSAFLEPAGRDMLRKVALNLLELDYTIDITGHTDSIPIRGEFAKRYPTNWELGAARASSVVRLFVEAGIDGERLVASSRAEYEPVASNEDAEGRSLNRRIEINLRPRVSTDLTGAELEDTTSAGAASESEAHNEDPGAASPS